MYRHGQEEIEAVSKVLTAGQWFRFGEASSGHLAQAATLEQEWSSELGTPYATFTNSGTSALMMAYAGLGLGPGDEVIVPGYTWLATAHAALALGVIPVIADINASLTLDPEAAERAITPRTRAICPVHMNGLAADMDAFVEIAKRRNVYLIEDACQADGGLWRDGKKLGTLGDAGAFSFNFYKVISCGDGGMFVTRHHDAYERAVIYHDGGAGFRPNGKDLQVPLFAGINLRGNEILAALMRVQLQRLPTIVSDLHRVRNSVIKAVLEDVRANLLPLNGGPTTGTAAHLALRFGDLASAKGFCERFNDDPRNLGAQTNVALSSGRHVYCNWHAVMEKRGAAHAAMNPFEHPRTEAPRYSKEMLPRTLEILGRSVLIAMNPDWSVEQAQAIADVIRDAVQ